MLKALEVQGFKSFADKTRFEFPAGITVVVGPNGSGKSNVVDAIKWVLGEQSAKSLRGKDMADVIFKGSGSVAGNRKPMNFAEATIVFENADGRLPVDAPEVHVTRRVYRGGEGEYLINRTPCRLKDIKDLFRGTGVGIDAYSIIEQGKVERILQASSKDRRAMFEEAAGISRFKAKKVEAQRRLERVDQNLLRLRDIVDEVEHRLKGIRAQAGKARRYREYSDRLQLLRTQTAWGDWSRLSAQLEQSSGELEELEKQLGQAREEHETAEARVVSCERESQAAIEELRRLEAQQSRSREMISTREAAMEFERTRQREINEETLRHRRQIAAMSHRVVGIRSLLKDIELQLASAEGERAGIATHLADHEAAVQAIALSQDIARKKVEQQRREYVALMRRLAELGNRASSAATQRESAREAIQIRQDRLGIVQTALANYELELESLRVEEAAQSSLVKEQRELLEAAQVELDKNRLVLSERLEDLAHLHGRLRGSLERATLLEDLESRREGLEAGVKAFLDRLRESASIPGIRGLVADLISAAPEHAAFIDTALGELAQAVVAEQSAAQLILQNHFQVQGRVVFLGLFPAPVRTATPDLRGRTGVVERVDRFATAASDCEELVVQLLGDTWLVETITDAVRLRSEGMIHCRFITRDGKRLDPSGSLVVGASEGAAGLISRRSELRSLREDLVIFRRQIDDAELEVAELRKNISTQESSVRRITDNLHRETDLLSERQVAIRAYQQRGEQLGRQRVGLEKELVELDSQVYTAEQEIQRVRVEQESSERELRELELAISTAELELRESDGRRTEHQQAATLCRIDLARSEQKVDAQRLQHFQAQEDERERDRLLIEAREQFREAQARYEAADEAILSATTELAETYLEKEQWSAQLTLAKEHGEILHQERASMAESAQSLRKTIRRLETQVHERQLSAGTLRHELLTLQERIREDYNLDLAALAPPQEFDARSREEIEEEISSLRKKINAVGAVNLEALNEIDELEARHQHLSTQYNDLASAKQQLEKIIHKINSDSRRIFLETLEAIRTNFQALYRRAFGGGKADLALEDGVDVLESGVDIMATPPGKPSFSNSLLSGGEKALTAVALLLAIFQFRPSPFCVLDEVDAPFDEANIGRFIEVLKDFLGETRFIIVTHSKKTMTSANTLYGVTMQESGVSKRVSVRFDDVSDDGHIRREAIEREEASEGKVA